MEDRCCHMCTKADIESCMYVPVGTPLLLCNSWVLKERDAWHTWCHIMLSLVQKPLGDNRTLKEEQFAPLPPRTSQVLRELYNLTFVTGSRVPVVDVISQLLAVPCPVPGGSKVCV